MQSILRKKRLVNLLKELKECIRIFIITAMKNGIK